MCDAGRLLVLKLKAKESGAVQALVVGPCLLVALHFRAVECWTDICSRADDVAGMRPDWQPDWKRHCHAKSSQPSLTSLHLLGSNANPDQARLHLSSRTISSLTFFLSDWSSIFQTALLTIHHQPQSERILELQSLSSTKLDPATPSPRRSNLVKQFDSEQWLQSASTSLRPREALSPWLQAAGEH